MYIQSWNILHTIQVHTSKVQVTYWEECVDRDQHFPCKAVQGRSAGQCQVGPNPLWPISQVVQDLELANTVRQSGKPNVYGLQIPIYSNWNFSLLDCLARSTSDREVVSFLRYGWPLNRELPVAVTVCLSNHIGALQYPKQVQEYLIKEMQHKTLVGPLCSLPCLDRMAVSPMSTIPKKHSIKRRIITDLSWPKGASVNDGIPKNEYVGQPSHIRYPTVDQLCFRAVTLSKGKKKGMIQGYKVDLNRAFRQIPMCPRDWSLLGTYWEGAIFLDKVAVMGSRTGPLACQRVTNMLRHFMADMGFEVSNYVDDFMGIELITDIWQAYGTIKNLLRDVGVNEALDKAVPPCYIIEFLGILFDLLTLTMSIPADKMQDLRLEVSHWLNKSMVSRKQLERLLGKLQFAGTCIRPGRVFVSRLIDTLKHMPQDEDVLVPMNDHLMKDLWWWHTGMQEHNGVSMMWLMDWTLEEGLAATDSCLTGMGAVLGDQCFRTQLPECIIQDSEWGIAHLELLAIIVFVQVFVDILPKRRLVLRCDNSAVVSIVNTGRSKNQLLQRCLRWLSYLLLRMECMIKLVHIASKDNEEADILSRSHTDPESRTRCDQMIISMGWRERVVLREYMVLKEDW